VSTARASLELGIQLSSLGGGPPGPLLTAAAAAGFAGVGLSSRETAQWIEAGLSVAELRDELDGRGLRADYLDPLMLSIGAHESAFPKLPDDRVIELALALGIPRINIIVGGDYNEAEAVEAFASTAGRLAAEAITPMLEFAPFFAVSNLHRAAAVVEGSAVSSAGILLDTWHLLRSGGVPEDLDAVVPGCIETVHLSDAPADAAADLLVETMNGRLYPGEGAARVDEVVRRVVAHSPAAVLTVEVYSPSLRGDDVDAFARRCYATARSLLPGARAD